MRGRTVAVIAGVSALAVGLSAWVMRGNTDVQYRTAAAERGDIAYTISATGTPNAVVTVQVGSQVSGNIKALYADFNTRVKKGQVVAEIDPQLFQARVDQARANLSAAQAAVLNAQAQIRKNEADVAPKLLESRLRRHRSGDKLRFVQADRARVEGLERRDGAQDRRLAGAGRAH